jgi:bis(5'-nucleosidyl)-tetraphosphatase
MRYETSYGIIPLRKNGLIWEVLLIQHQAGHWSFPKGHAEIGETPKQAAERELFEETGLKVDHYLAEEPFSEKYYFSFQGQRIGKTVLYFLAQVKGDVLLQEKEVKSSLWVAVHQAEAVISFAEGKALCRQVRFFLIKALK